MTADSNKPPKRTLKDVGTIEGNVVVPKMAKRLNDAALKICRLNILSAAGRTRLEQYRSDSLNASNKREYKFKDDIYINSSDREVCFLMYVGYWYGQFRHLNNVWNKKQIYNKQAWGKLNKVVKLMEAVSEIGLDATFASFNDKKQRYFCAKRK